MSKIGISIGLTLKLGENSYEFFRPEIRIDDIDTEEDVGAQLDVALQAIESVWDPSVNLAAKRVKETIDREIFSVDTVADLKGKLIALARKVKILEDR